MKYNIRLTAFAATALLFAACTQTELDDSAAVVASQNGDNAVVFGTYMSGNEQTRAGYQGSIDTNTLKDLNATGNPVSPRLTNGFGVFGYYTGNTAYAQATKANFMYNEHVYYDKAATADYISHWVYAPMKFWPNEVQDGTSAWKVDDQDNDHSDNQAYTDGGKGGNVSFFAYAPYVELSESADLSTTDGGIIMINGDARYGGNSKAVNPTVEYVVASKGEKVVDLLWGTAGTASPGVTGAANTGVAASSAGSATDYQKAILPGYTVNADLTKQKTNGKVEFAFKHALAKVGGSTIYSNNPSGVSKYGLMVVLDLDDQKGAEGGGKMETNPGSTGYPTNTTKAPNLTKVTVQDVQIVGRSLIPHDNKNPGEDGYVDHYLERNQGTLDLATGKWSLANGGSVTSGEATVTHKITSEKSSAADKAAKAGELSTEIAEPAALTNPTPADAAQRITNFEDLPVGVTTKAQNVYKSEAYPLVFIPGTYPELTITVTYTVRTYDPNLYRKYTEVTQKITKKVTFKQAVELNKQYSLLMHLGLTSVKFSATVSDWDHTVITPDVSSESGATAVAEEAVEHIYIPRNVGDTDLGTATVISHTNGKTYAIIFKQDGREPGDLYFSTSKPITIKAYEVNNETGAKTPVPLDGTAYGIEVLCTGNNTHFNHSITYASGDAELNTPTAEKDIVHAPVTITFVVGGSATSVKSNIYIWPENKLPYFLK